MTAAPAASRVSHGAPNHTAAITTGTPARAVSTR